MKVEDYLQRICYDGPQDTTASTLKELCISHIRKVPFEAFDLFGGERKILSLEKIYHDIVVNKRGGFCYENNGLFGWLLRKIGYNADLVQAQAYVHSQQVFCPEFDHMAFLVSV